MDITPSVSWLDLRAALFLLCMVPLLCSSKETKSVSIEPKQQVSYEDFVNIHNLPKYATDSDISVEYMCTKPCVIHVDIMASSEFRTGILVFKKRWKNEKYLGVTRTRSVSLVFPRHMVYRIDYFQKHSINVYFSVVRAWLVHNDTISMMSKYNETILNATARSSNVLEPVPLLQRPYRDRQICLSWDFEVTWRKRENSLFICPFETDLVTMLGFPLASSSEHNGIVATFDRFRNRELELRRQQRISGNPRFTFSAWMYLLNFCSGKECGILHHIDSQKKYATPLLFLNEEGQMHVQMQVSTGAVVAVLSNLQLPLHRWFRFDITVRGHKIELATSVGAELKSSSFQTYNLVEDNYFDDTDGYMVIGGSKYMLGIDGFFGPVKYYRLRALTTDDISNPILEEEIYPLIAEYYQRCSTAQDIVTFHASVMRETQEIQAEGISRNDYVDLYFKHRLKTTCPVLPVREEERHQYSHLLKFLKSVDFTSSDFSNAPDIGRMLYQSVIERLRDSLRHLGAAVPSLQDASCLGNHKASYLLAAMYEVGLDAPTDPVQGLLYSLVGAQGGDRLALLKLGYHHLEGIHSYPLDLGISYAYYFSVAKKTPQDRWTKHEQAYVETIRLMDDHVLKEQTRENDDLFMWLKQNAERGDARAQHRLAQMYFWGQQGVTKNIDAALQWYERGALENNDPLLMYDYAIILLKGDSVPKNKKLALKLMKKSAAKGQHEAFNGLGWYYHTFLKDYGKAAKYWKKAYDMGNVDAAFNLGIMHLNGVHPGEPEANHTQAFKLITRASTGGHLEGTVHLSQFLITGSVQGVKRDPKEAIRWAKVAAEQNGLIGHVIRKALNAYIDGSLSEALLYYTLTAEAGIEVAQTNLAYICEEHPDITTPYLRETCAWRYYNRSVYQNNPSSYALLKMGDLYYSGSRDYPRNLDRSMRLYSKAALQGDAQGYYNLAVLTQEGISIPTYLLQYLKINGSLCGSKEALALELYDRCQRHSNEDIVSPCSLVLLYHHVTAAWESILHSSLMYMLGSFILSLTVTVLVRCIHLVQDISSSENSNHLPEGERGGPSAPMMRQTHSVPAGLQRFYTYHLAQTIRRHREWLCPALLVCLCMVYLSFITRSI